MSSIYLHIPYCAQKCPYCDFYSLAGSRDELADYVRLLKQNISLLGREAHGQAPLATIFFGGGTPSLLDPGQLSDLLAHLDATLGMADQAEITLEANPGTVSSEKLRDYRQAGLNRLSLGIQSLDDRNLKRLGRIHSSRQAVDALRNARQAGFDNISLDLMFALPGQTLEQCAAEVQGLVALEPEHISLYGLSIEPDTPFAEQLARGELRPCGDNLYTAQYRRIDALLADAGYEHYEISNFARPGRRCRHNQVYWQRRSCLAVGCGAHGYLDRNWGERWHIPADLKAYRDAIRQRRNPAVRLETFTCESAMSEYCYLALRTRDGLDLETFRNRFHRDAESYFAAALSQCRGYLEKKGANLHFNLDGWLIYDTLISHFL